jgi:hypothetical protein
MQTPSRLPLRALVSLLTLASLACPALAGITLKREVVSASTPWAKSFNKGTLSLSTPIEPGDGVVPIDIDSMTFAAQSFLGNGGYLRAIALYGGGLDPEPTDYTVTLLDYGPKKPMSTMQEFNPMPEAPVLADGTIKLVAGPTAQLYIAFEGADSVLLRKDRVYVFMIASTRSSKSRIFRTTTSESYPDGHAAAGPGRLSPYAFSREGLRDLVFAVYSSPTKP